MGKLIHFLRCFIFDVIYFIWTAGFSILMVWSLLLPFNLFMSSTRLYNRGIHFLEKLLLGLDYEVRGTENIPKDSAYIIAFKHQSTYETLKAQLVFPNSIMILKKELGQIPFWGWYAQKMRFIFVNRSNPREAAKSLVEASHKLKESGRNLLIYPQGTRVKIEETLAEKPYKKGVAKIYAESELPILPVATNAGYFWPRNSFWKRSGKVVFEILPEIEPGLSESDVLKTLEHVSEEASHKLLEEARAKS